MTYTNSSLVEYEELSPNNSGKRLHSIDRITPHCTAGLVSISGLGSWFAKKSTKASSNYGIDKNGKIGMFVPEKYRSWCSSSSANDQRAVTIECASEDEEPYTMTSTVYNKLVELCVDICKRYNKTKLLWFGDKEKTLAYIPKDNEMVLTVHRWFANKSCPGNWLYNRLDDLANTVTSQLQEKSVSSDFPDVPFKIKVLIDNLNIRKSPKQSTTNLTGKYTGKGIFTIVEISGKWGKLKSGAGWIYLGNSSYTTY